MNNGVSDLLGKSILVIEDDLEMLRLLELILARKGALVHTAVDGKEGLRKFYAYQPDLVLLDLMMPHVDGWQVCERIRHLSDVPVVVLTALNADQDVVRGLSCGADDYMTKPFEPAILLARAQAALRRLARSNNGASAVAYSDGHLTIDLDQRWVLVAGERVSLTPTEYRLLAYLVQNAGRVLTFGQILDNVWGVGYEEREANVHVYISRLRGKLELDPRRPRYLLSERGVGYRFEKRPARPERASVDAPAMAGRPE